MAYGYGFIYMISAQVVFFLVTIGLIIWFLKTTKQKERATPKYLLNKRLASGEINQKEYNSLFKIINKEN